VFEAAVEPGGRQRIHQGVEQVEQSLEVARQGVALLLPPLEVDPKLGGPRNGLLVLADPLVRARHEPASRLQDQVDLRRE